MAGFLQQDLAAAAAHKNRLQDAVASFDSWRVKDVGVNDNLQASWRGLGYQAASEVSGQWDQTSLHVGTNQLQVQADGVGTMNTHYDATNTNTYGIMRALTHNPGGTVTA
jgi:hypothetical protein